MRDSRKGQLFYSNLLFWTVEDPVPTFLRLSIQEGMFFVGGAFEDNRGFRRRFYDIV